MVSGETLSKFQGAVEDDGSRCHWLVVSLARSVTGS